MALSHTILRNFWLKFFSVALATVIWLGIHYGIRNELSISRLNINEIKVPVAITLSPGDARVFKISPAEVVVFAVGEKSALRKGVRVSVDLTNFRARQSPSEDLHTDAPPEINVLEVSPPTVSVLQVSP